MREYEKEKKKYFILELIASSKEAKVIMDDNNYKIGRNGVGYATWIWTKDNISKDKELEIIKRLEDEYIEGLTPITCKKEFYETLLNHFQVSDYFEMAYLECNRLGKRKHSTGFVDKPNYGDKTTLAKYWIENVKELNQKEITMVEALQEIESWFEEGKTYVYRDTAGKVVSVASYMILDHTAKISHVFTPKEERRKGYCQNLIYELTKILLEEGYEPMLYTDYHYIPSNHAYKKVGYRENGILINCKIKRQE